MKHPFKAFCLSLLLAGLTFSCAGEPAGTDDNEVDAGVETSASPTAAGPIAGLPAPDRTLSAGGQTIPVYDNFSDLEGIFNNQNDTTYIINFWATWCKPCVEEMPYFEQLHRTFQSEKMQVILVSLDFERDLDTKLTRFVDEKQLQSEVVVLLDGNYNSWIDRVDPQWGGAIPATIIYKGNDRHFIGQQLAGFQELEEIVRSMM